MRLYNENDVTPLLSVMLRSLGEFEVWVVNPLRGHGFTG